MKYTVYQHVAPNGKRYIGLTGQKVNTRWRNGDGYQTCTYFNHAIEKYGWENIEHKIMDTNLSKEQATNLEIELIKKFDTTNPIKGYNLTTGGENFKHSISSREQMSESTRIRNIENPPVNIKISYEIADEIRRDYLTGKYKVNELSEIYEVSSPTISNVIANKIWTDDDYIPPKLFDINDARIIRNDYTNGEYTYRELAEKYNIGKSSIWSIVNNKTWIDEEYMPPKQFTIKDARKIRADYATGNYSQADLCRKYNIKDNKMSRLIRNKTWVE